jgi:hypothetical protein
MKVAFCISGVPQDIHFCANFIKKYSEMYETYVFIHHWTAESQNKIQHHSYSGRVYKQFDYNIYKNVASYAEVKSEIFDKKIPTFLELKKQWPEMDKQMPSGHRPDIGPVSMFYGIAESQKMRQEFEKKHGFKFDVVMRCRFETDFAHNVDWEQIKLEKYDMKKIWIPRYNERFEDVFGFSSSENMDKYAKVYENIVPLVKKVGLEPEFLLGLNVSEHNVMHDRIDFVNRFCRYGFGHIGYVLTPLNEETNKMKLALCISGIPAYKHSNEFIQKFKDLGYDTYVFIHYWEVENQKKAQRHSWSGREYIPFDESIYKIGDSPLVIKKEKFDERLPYLKEIAKQWEEVDRHPRGQHRTDLGTLSMIYGIREAQKLREQYEAEHNFKFDCVMRIRFETTFSEERLIANVYQQKKYKEEMLKLENYDMNKLWFSNSHNPFEDIFTMSNSENMTKYSQCFENIVPLVFQVGLHPESVLATWCSQVGFQFGRCDFVDLFTRFGFSHHGAFAFSKEEEAKIDALN